RTRRGDPHRGVAGRRRAPQGPCRGPARGDPRTFDDGGVGPNVRTAAHQALRIAAVIPKGDRAALTVRAVESALAQSRAPDEVIVIDDGSLDDTRQRMAAFGDAVRCISRSPGGASSARNRGVLEASAGWIAFLDSDDVWQPEHLERMDAAIAATSGAAAMYFADVEFEEDARSSWERSEFTVGPRYELHCD